MLLHYLGKLKIEIFCCRYGRKFKQVVFLIASNFVIHPQIWIFLVFKIASLFLLWTNMFSVASPDNRQNDCFCAPRDTRKCSIAAERLLRCRWTFSKSLMVLVAVSKLGCSPFFFVEPSVKVVITGTC